MPSWRSRGGIVSKMQRGSSISANPLRMPSTNAWTAQKWNSPTSQNSPWSQTNTPIATTLPLKAISTRPSRSSGREGSYSNREGMGCACCSYRPWPSNPTSATNSRTHDRILHYSSSTPQRSLTSTIKTIRLRPHSDLLQQQRNEPLREVKSEELA